MSLSVVTADAMASTPQLFSTSPRKPIAQEPAYLWDRTLGTGRK